MTESEHERERKRGVSPKKVNKDLFLCYVEKGYGL